jgi:large subunit ribosomal protein L9
MAQNVSVILARDVANLGRVGELVTVRPGYARNFLVPTGLALPASPKRVAFFEHQKKVIEHKRRQLKGESEKKAKEMSGVQVTLTVKVGEQGKLFGAITARDISRALTAVGHPIHHKDVKLGDPIKAVGIHTVDVRLEADVAAQVKVIVAAEVISEEEQAAAAAQAAAEAAILAKPAAPVEAEEGAEPTPTAEA